MQLHCRQRIPSGRRSSGSLDWPPPPEHVDRGVDFEHVERGLVLSVGTEQLGLGIEEPVNAEWSGPGDAGREDGRRSCEVAATDGDPREAGDR